MATGIWSAGGSLNTGRRVLASCGSQSTGLCFGGYTTVNVATTEEYNGTNWTASNDMNTARNSLAGCGSQTAGLSFGGSTGATVATTEEYNGTSWTASNDMNTARNSLAGCGSQTAGLSMGGHTSSVVATTEEYNGTSWTAVNDMNIARHRLAGCGSQTAGLSMGGNSGGGLKVTEQYNGTSWLVGGDLNVTREYFTGCGSQSAGLSIGGFNILATTEHYDIQQDISLVKGLVLHCPLDMNSYNANTKRFGDKSAYRNHGTSANTLGGANFTTDHMSQVNRSMIFNGTDDYVDINKTSAEIGLTVEGFTISLRFKTSHDFIGDLGYLINAYLFSWIINIGANNKLYVFNTLDISNQKWNISTNVVNDGKWKHAITTFNSDGSTDLWIDNVELLNHEGVGVLEYIHFSTQDIHIGRRASTADRYFNGQLEDVRIYNRALTQEERTLLYESYRQKMII